MILSFSITSRLAALVGIPDPLLTGIKSVSRRNWSEKYAAKWAKVYYEGQRGEAWSALPFVPGAKKLGTFELLCPPYQEALKDMPDCDVFCEGNLWRDKQHFIDQIGNGNPEQILWVIRWHNFVIDDVSKKTYIV
ncbi:MAG: hypothetical protein ACREPR_24170 [Brasilonema sp.]